MAAIGPAVGIYQPLVLLLLGDKEREDDDGALEDDVNRPCVIFERGLGESVAEAARSASSR